MTILTAVMLAESRLPRTGGAMGALFVVAGISVADSGAAATDDLKDIHSSIRRA